VSRGSPKGAEGGKIIDRKRENDELAQKKGTNRVMQNKRLYQNKCSEPRLLRAVGHRRELEKERGVAKGKKNGVAALQLRKGNSSGERGGDGEAIKGQQG